MASGMVQHMKICQGNPSYKQSERKKKTKQNQLKQNKTKIKEKSCEIISFDTEKAFDKIQQL